MVDGLVSIITPSYNSVQFVSETIKSVLGQTYQDWELLIVDDCSKDNSVVTLQMFADIDKRIKVFSLKQMLGQQLQEMLLWIMLKDNILHFLIVMMFGRIQSWKNN